MGNATSVDPWDAFPRERNKKPAGGERQSYFEFLTEVSVLLFKLHFTNRYILAEGSKTHLPKNNKVSCPI